MRVSVVNSVCRARDAISESVHETCLAIMDELGWDCRLFTFASDFNDVPTTRVAGVVDVLQDPFFAASDVHLFHFGLYSPLFTLLAAGTSRTKRVVRFHNVTPKEFVPIEMQPLIDQSHKQIALIDTADEIWADSPYNRNDLIEYGIPSKRILVEPLFGKPLYTFHGKKPRGQVNMLYVGRFVASKGVLDLIEAIVIVRQTARIPIHVNLVGSFTFSDANYIDIIRERITALNLDDMVSFAGELDDAALMRHYHDAHLVVIPSYHEGFCVPLVEAIHAKAIPVGYGAGNIPFLLDGVGEIVPTGDIEALARSLGRLVDWHGAGWEGHSAPLPLGQALVEPSVYAARVARHAQIYSTEQFRYRVTHRLNLLVNLT